MCFWGFKPLQLKASASLRLNTAKNRAVFFETKYRVRTLPGLHLPGVEFVDEALSLGVILDSFIT